jgi:hypothetical protein
MISKIEAVPEMDAFVSVVLVIVGQGREHSKLNPRGIAVLLNRADDFDGAASFALFVIGFNDLAECSLPEKPRDSV